MSDTLQHATTVDIGGRGVMIRGASGSGKTSLALALMERGATLVADDYTQLRVENDRIIATAPDTIKGKIEVRGYGLIDTTHQDQTAVSLIVDIVPHENVPRLPDSTTDEICKIVIPRLLLGVHDAAASGKIKAVLKSLQAKV